MLQKLSIALIAIALSACGGGGGGTSYKPSGANTMGAVVATGAPLANVPFTITRLANNAVVASGTVGLDAYLQAQVSQTDAPFIVKVTDTGVTPNVELENLVLPSDFDGDGKVNTNVTPISTIVTKIVRGQLGDLSKITVAELTIQRTAAANVVKTALDPLLAAANASVTSGTDLIRKVFIPISDPLDKVLDSIQVNCTSGSGCTITPTSAKATSDNGVMSINTNSVAAASASASTVSTTLVNAKDEMLSTAPVVVVFGSGGAWGAANDAWAGYTGKFTVYNFTDQAIDGNAVLYFESSKLKQNGFWDVTATVANDKFSITLPNWGNIPPKTNNSVKPSSYTFGFNGSGVPSAVTDISACNINGKKCLVLIDDVTLDVSAANSSEVKVRSWTNFLSTLPSTVSSNVVTIETQQLPPPSNTSTSQTVQSAQQDNTSNAANTGSANAANTGSANAANTGTAKIALTSTTSWSGGFNGELQLTNTSGSKWTSWKVTFIAPSSVKAIGGWGNYKISSAGSSYTFENESWNGTLETGKMIKLGFGGSGSLGSTDVPANCTISMNGGAPVQCTIAAQTVTVPTNQPTGANTSSTTVPTPVPPAPPDTTSTSQTSSANSSGSSAPANSNTSLANEPTTIAGSIKADQTKRVYVGYYPSWSDNWFSSKDYNGNSLSDDAILNASKLARIPGTYTHVVVAFAQPNFSYSTSDNFTANSWSGTGLNFNAGPQDIRRAVGVLHARGMKVIVAVGGATYNNWAALAAENGSETGAITNSLKQMMIDMDFDGLDVDYEVDGTNTAEYTGAVNAMRKAVDLANASDGKSRWLTVAGWSTGADPAGTYWGGKSGGERLVFSQPGMAAKIDMMSIMSYDARFENYDGVKAWQYYRDLFPSTTIVNIGLETAPEGWAGGMLVVENADAQCEGSTILKNQAGEPVNLPYSVHRYAGAVIPYHSKSNARDGAMIWQILKTATATCGSVTVASPSTIAKKISDLYGLPSDPRAAWK